MAAQPRRIFINLHVEALNPAIEFYTKIGFEANKKFGDDNAMMMTLERDSTGIGIINVMLLTQSFFHTFLPGDRERHDATKSTEVINCLTASSRDDVDNVVKKAGDAGGKLDVNNMPEMPNMYGRSFEDLDGHIWEVMWMDVNAEPTAC